MRNPLSAREFYTLFTFAASYSTAPSAYTDVAERCARAAGCCVWLPCRDGSAARRDSHAPLREGGCWLWGLLLVDPDGADDLVLVAKEVAAMLSRQRAQHVDVSACALSKCLSRIVDCVFELDAFHDASDW